MHITLPIIANLRLNTPPLTYKRHVLKQQKKKKKTAFTCYKSKTISTVMTNVTFWRVMGNFESWVFDFKKKCP